MDWVALSVFVFLFLVVTVLGFVASRWRRGDLNLIDEWGLAGRRLGTLITWFLLGGDIYTAYTFIAVPALVFGAGAIGFFALPYTIIVYPFVFAVFPRLWSVAEKHGYVTASDFVLGRFDSRPLALAVACTGILATMPYIALQLVGIQVVLAGMGISGGGIVGDLPLIIAFVILAAFTYSSGLRAPAMIAVVKDLLIYITVFVAVIIVPMKLGGYGAIFASISHEKLILPAPPVGSTGSYTAYASLALGSALALFLYPHAVTGVLSASSRRAIMRNSALLPAYTFVLGLIALLGYMAIAAGVGGMPGFSALFKQYGPNFAVPALFVSIFPSWFVGFAFAAIAIGALVPASIMSIATANLFTRNIYKEYFRPECDKQEEAKTAKIASLVVKFGALVFILFLPQKYAIQLQLLGGVWIIQTLPAVVLGLYTRWLHRHALLLGWAIGIITGTGMVASLGFASSIYPVSLGGITIPCYAALASLVVNLVVAVLATLLLGGVRSTAGQDETRPYDYQETIP